MRLAHDWDKDDDGIPLVKPISCGREGPEPLIIKFPSLREEDMAITDHLAQAYKEGFALGDMVILCPDYRTRDLCVQVMHQRKMPVEMRRSLGDFGPTSDTIKVMTMRVSKGLEFPVVALAGVGRMPAKGEDEKEAARMFYVAATRATQRLMIEVDGGLRAGYRSSVSVLQRTVTSDAKRSSSLPRRCLKVHIQLCALSGIAVAFWPKTCPSRVVRDCLHDIAYNSTMNALQRDEK